LSESDHIHKVHQKFFTSTFNTQSHLKLSSNELITFVLDINISNLTNTNLDSSHIHQVPDSKNNRLEENGLHIELVRRIGYNWKLENHTMSTPCYFSFLPDMKTSIKQLSGEQGISERENNTGKYLFILVFPGRDCFTTNKSLEKNFINQYTS